MNRHSDFLRPLKRLRRDPLGAPRDVPKQTTVSLLDAKQIVAASGRRPEHLTVSGLRQNGSGLYQDRCRQSRTVGIDDNRALMTAIKQLTQCTIKAITEIRIPGLEQTDVGQNRDREKVDGIRPW